MEKRGLKQTDLAAKIGRDQTLISRYLTGQIEISDTAARSMAEVLNIDFEEMRRQLQRDRFERRKKNLTAEFKEVLTKEDKAEISPSEETAIIGGASIEEIISIPFLNSIPKNNSYKSRDKGESYVLPSEVTIDPENSFAIKVKDESITDDKVDQGDIIVVDTSAKITNGDRVLIIIDAKPILRRIYLTGETIVLQSSNSNEPVRVLSKGDDFRIVGKLAGCYKQF